MRSAAMPRAEKSMLELRAEPRKSMTQAGWIVEDGGRKRPCLLTNLSKSGAKITLLARNELPPEFTLCVGQMSRRSRMIWRTCFNAGLQFEPAHSP
jgi:hypothetical protein